MIVLTETMLGVSLHVVEQFCTSSLRKCWCRAIFCRAVSECCSMVSNHNAELIECLQKLCEIGRLQEAIEVTDTHVAYISINIYQCLLQSCIIKKDLAAGRKVHSLILKSGFESNAYLGSYLIRMFDLCGSLLEANEVFVELPYPNVFAWSAIISACTKHGQGEQAIKLYQKMQESNVQPDGHVFVAGLKACARETAFTQGILVHMQVIEKGFDSMLYVCNALIDMYAKCGNLQEARKVFDNQVERDTVTWNAMIAGYALNMQAEEAFELFMHMQHEGKADTVTIVSILKACSSIAALSEGNLIFLLIIENGFESEEFVGSTLIDMYAKCGCLDDACSVFDKLSKHDVVTWNALIAGLAQFDGYQHGYKTLELFQKMKYQHCKMPDMVTYVSILKACSSIGSLAQGKFIHTCIIESGFATDIVVLNTLISMYADCGSPYDAFKMFKKMHKRDEVTWNAMIAGYTRHGLFQEAFQLFQKMQQEGGKPDVVAWNSLIAGYAQHGYGLEALVFSKQMQQEGFVPDKYTFVSILNACASIGALEQGRLVHLHILECGILSDIFVANTLIDMYAKCGSLVMAYHVFDKSSKQYVVTWNAMIAGYAQHGHHEKAHRLFQKMKQGQCDPDTITWNAMIAGLVQHGNVNEALQLFGEMLSEGMQPDNATFVSMVKGCSLAGVLDLGKLIYAHATANSLELAVAICNSLIDMYAKCGSLKEACFLFESLPKRDLVTWNTIIAAYSLHNETKLSLNCFESMQREGLKPDGATFATLLSACSHMGLMNEGYQWFKSMKDNHGVTPTLEHFNCLVDLLGRAGHLTEAEGLLKAMLPESDVVGWIALLSSCKTYGNVELGRHCFYQVVEMDDTCGSGFVLMSNIFADANFWDDASKIQALRKSSVAWRKPGMAFVGADGKLFKFTVGEKSHSAAIYDKLKRLTLQFKQLGWVPVVNLILEPVADNTVI